MQAEGGSRGQEERAYRSAKRERLHQIRENLQRMEEHLREMGDHLRELDEHLRREEEESERWHRRWGGAPNRG